VDYVLSAEEFIIPRPSSCSTSAFTQGRNRMVVPIVPIAQILKEILKATLAACIPIKKHCRLQKYWEGDWFIVVFKIHIL